MSTLEGQRKIDREETDRRIFHNRCEHFIKRWAPADLYERSEFTADLMMLFRDLQVSQAEAYGRIVAQQMALQPLAMTLKA